MITGTDDQPSHRDRFNGSIRFDAFIAEILASVWNEINDSGGGEAVGR